MRSRPLWIGSVLLAAAGLLVTGGCKRQAPQPPSATEVREFGDAVHDGDATVVDRLLSAKPALANTPGENGEMPLSTAQRQGNEELVQVLKRHGAR